MRIVFVIPVLAVGGAERVLSTIANYWNAHGTPISVVTLDDGSDAPFFALDDGIEHTPLGVSGPSSNAIVGLIKNIGRIIALRRSVRRLRPDVVVSFLDQTNVLTLFATRGLSLPVIVSEHSEPSLYSLSRVWERLRLLSYRWAYRVVVLTETAQDYFATRTKCRTIIIPNPIAVPLEESREPPETLKRPCLIAVGRLSAEKNYPLLLEASARAVSRHPEWTLAILGDGPMRKELESLAARLNIAQRVTFLGTVSNPTMYLRQADLFVLSSNVEGFPCALVEAMDNGLAVISTRYHNGIFKIIDDGVNGVIVPPNDLVELANAMERLMKDPTERLRLAHNARNIRERFDTDTIMQTWMSLFEDARQFHVRRTTALPMR